MVDPMICPAKHTAFQPTDEQWRCPKCGADNEFFVIVELSSDECDKLHEQDEVGCGRCEGGWTGKKLASIMAKRLHLVTCPTCKGKGVVDEVK